jgi:hypothetical protein
VPLAFVFGSSRRSNVIVTMIYVAALAWIVIGAHASIPANLPWYMGGWLALDGLVQRPFVVLFTAVALVMIVVWQIVKRVPRLAIPSLAALVAATAVALAVADTRGRVSTESSRTPSPCAGGCDYLDTTSTFIRSGLVEGWRWIAANIHDGVVAYTGINLPYPLFGERLTNRVVYVNIDSHRRWRLHDYDRAYRDGRFTPEPPLLAVSSGELRPLASKAGPRDDASRPRYERMQGYRDAWLANLEALGVTHLVVSALSAYEIDYMWHNEGGFPIEDEWARNDPRSFRLLYENPQLRVYGVTLPTKADR